MSKSDKSFEKDLAELEALVQWFESEEVDIDTAVKKFEQGVELSRKLKKQLNQMENQIENLRETLEDTRSENAAES